MDYELNLVPTEETIKEDIARKRVIKSIGDFIDKLIILENELGHKVSQEFLDPKSLNLTNTYDSNEISRVANEIANFLGLSNEVHVNIDESSTNVDVSITKIYDYSIIINLSQRTLKIADTLLAILAHELTNLYLLDHGIDLTDKSTQDKKLLIDIAAIYLGLGKLILNGHRNKKKQEISKKEYTVQMYMGYTHNHYLGFIYKTVCNMRNIPESVYNENLTSRGKIYIAQAMTHNEILPYLHHNFFDDNFTTKTLTKIKEVLYSIQILLSDMEKISKNNKISIIEIESLLIQTHQKLFKYSRFIADFAEMKEYLSQRLKYLYSMKTYQTLEEMLLSFDTVFYSAKSYFDRLRDTANSKNSNLAVSTSSNMCSVICRNDGTELQYPPDKPPFIIKCPNCGYQFIASTDSILHNEEVKDFITLYKEHFAVIETTTESRVKIIEDEGFIEPILRYLLYHPLLSLGLIFIILGITINIVSHIFYSLIFYALGFVFVISDIFKLYEIYIYPGKYKKLRMVLFITTILKIREKIRRK